LLGFGQGADDVGYAMRGELAGKPPVDFADDQVFGQADESLNALARLLNAELAVVVTSGVLPGLGLGVADRGQDHPVG
jgi:hypothetical protein